MRAASKKQKGSLLLTVGGHDPSGHAGVRVDQKVWDAYGIAHYTILTAVTAQSRKQFLSWEPVSLRLFTQQLKTLLILKTESKQRLWGVKIGMLATSRHAQLLADWLSQQSPKPYVIWDPVWRSSTGTQLLKAKYFSSSFKALLKQSQGFTPNIPEAQWILRSKGLEQADSELEEKNKCRTALKALDKMGQRRGRWVLLKGGHSLDPVYSKDWLYQGGRLRVFQARRRKEKTGEPFRGTGCRLASCILAELSQGRSLESSIQKAKENLFNF